MKNRESIIAAQSLSIGYSEKRKNKQSLYHNLSFDLYKGELVCLIGANGSGKSTLLRTISNMQPALDGQITILNKNILDYRDKELSQLMGLVLTDKTASGGFTVREVVELGRYPYTGFFGQLNSEDDEIVEQAMKDAGISHKSNSFLADLSDGERQKAMIAKALSQECPIILLDEPTAFLDMESKIEVMNLLHSLAHKQQKTILLSTHDINLAFLLADKLWLLSREEGLTIGTTEDIILSGTIDKHFSNENIKFNKYSGAFYPIRKNEKKVYVEAKDEFLFWIINLLLRLGLDYTTQKEKAIYTIKAEDIDTITLIKDNIVLKMRDFEELSSYIRNQD